MGYTDANWGGSINDRISTSGHCMYLGGNPVVWRSKKKALCAISSVEVEYKVVAMRVTELL